MKVNFKKTYNKTILGQIIIYLDNKGISASNIKHIGNNVFEMDFSEGGGFLSGIGGICQYTVKNGKVICLKRKINSIS